MTSRRQIQNMPLTRGNHPGRSAFLALAMALALVGAAGAARKARLELRYLAVELPGRQQTDGA